MGAKVAMTLACKYPDRVSSLISLDTAPVSHANDDRAIKQTIDHLK
jgi:pimeloyl-ACP methyl ester carboxylesterase